VTSAEFLTLPIDPLLPDVVAALRADRALVIEAPPGAGKTTRVPRALLEAGIGDGGEIWVLEPRRLPARLAAERVARERGERVGETVGYTVRFEDVSSARTRLRFVTEGLLTRRLLSDPELRGVAAVVLDEFHERHVATDLALALLARLQRGARPDLRLAAMSATLEAAPLRAFLECAGLRSEGRLHPVDIEHLPAPDDRPLHEQVVGAVRRVLREGPAGDVLVFLPGAAEIRRAEEALRAAPGAGELLILPLHGELPLEEQTRAVRPDPARRKVILSTNVAESSVTVEGVVAVVDSGLARVATHSPWTGLPTLAVQKISQAAATQRAGRAGRTRPGRALRLYTRHDHDARRPHDVPEIARADLAETLLSLAALDVGPAGDFPWFERPPAPALDAARELLGALGALDGAGRLTPLGRRMARFPVHPRLARLICEGEARGAARASCLVAALVSERDIRRGARAAFGRGGGRGGGLLGSAEHGEILDLVDLFREAEEARFRADKLRALELDARATDGVARARRHLEGGLDRGALGRALAPRSPEEDMALRLATLAAFPDRVARRRTPTDRAVVLAGGGSAELQFDPGGEWLVAVDVEERGAGPRATGGRPGGVAVRLAAAIEPEWLLEVCAGRVEEIDTLAFNPQTERVERRTGLRLGALALDETVAPAPPGDETSRLLAEAALARGLDRLPGAQAFPQLLARLAFARDLAPEGALPPLAADDVAALLRLACAGRRGFAELAEADLPTIALESLGHEAQRLLRTLAPERVTLPGGRSVAVNYVAGQPPWIESRLQDFFGMRAGPTVGGGRVPLTLHLLAPNGRAVQVTRDLASFWTQHYPALRRELGRRYPRHAWPEDGATATPPPPKPARRQ
jgi:ATP-dependent helicase HrpB